MGEQDTIMTGQNMTDRTGWTQVSCPASDRIRDEHLDKVVSSSLTDLDGEYGDPVVYTEWSVGDVPLLRDYRWVATERECEHWIPDAEAAA